MSIIVPVWNSQAYLRECLESIEKQVLISWECICVDDGSDDSSPEILRSFALRDSRFHVLHQVNMGVSAARNTGLQSAKGKYVVFVDSDDYVDEEYLQILLSPVISDPDLDFVSAGMKKRIRSGLIEDMDIYAYPRKRKHRITPIFCTEYLYGYPFCKLFKMEIIRRKHLKFNAKYVMLEDHDFCMRYYSCCRKMLVLESRLYYYRETPCSAVDKFGRGGYPLHVYSDVCELYADFLMEMQIIWSDDERKRYGAAMVHLFFHRFAWVVAIWSSLGNREVMRVICRKVCKRIPELVRFLGIWYFLRSFPIRHLKQTLKGVIAAA